jgi:hypothetical protein
MSVDLQLHADTERFAKLRRAIAWFDSLPSTTIPDVVAAQRARAIEELLQIVFRRASRKP